MDRKEQEAHGRWREVLLELMPEVEREELTLRWLIVDCRYPNDGTYSQMTSLIEVIQAHSHLIASLQVSAAVDLDIQMTPLDHVWLVSMVGMESEWVR